MQEKQREVVASRKWWPAHAQHQRRTRASLANISALGLELAHCWSAHQTDALTLKLIKKSQVGARLHTYNMCVNIHALQSLPDATSVLLYLCSAAVNELLPSFCVSRRCWSAARASTCASTPRSGAMCLVKCRCCTTARAQPQLPPHQTPLFGCWSVMCSGAAHPRLQGSHAVLAVWLAVRWDAFPASWQQPAAAEGHVPASA